MVRCPSMTAAGLDSQEAEPGDRFGRYEILARLAAGGMGRVYLARALGPGGFEKTVALKTIHPDLASRADFVEMFLHLMSRATTSITNSYRP